jgi:hypothetical protein
MLASATPAAATTCYYSVNNAYLRQSGDSTLSRFTCWQAYVSWAWRAYGFRKQYWDDGFGFHDVCNPSKALGRMMNAIYVLTYADSWRPAAHGDRSGSVLRWGQAYAFEHVDETHMRCDLGGAMADFSGSRMRWSMVGVYGGFNGDIGAYQAGGWDDSAALRSAIVLHEARHADKGHDGGTRCPLGGSCDSSWGYNGANRWELAWLWWYAFAGGIGNPAQSDLALSMAATLRDEFFVTAPAHHLKPEPFFV